jgi:glycogen debranching enzyme
MKLVAACLAAFGAFACMPAIAGTSSDAFFNAMAIDVAPGQQSHYVVGDNVAGYFDGRTQSYDKGEGYVRREGVLFQSYATFADGRRNERSHSKEQVLPYGHRVSYANGATEQMALLSKKNAIAMTVTARKAAVLAIRPLLKEHMVVSQQDGMVVVQAGRQFMAYAANQPVTVDSELALRTAQPALDMTVVAAFGSSASEAAQRARALVADNPISAERELVHAALTKSVLTTSDAQYNKALLWAKAASRMFVVEEFGTGIWAGLPWFRDNWGRDTFIALPGTLLVAGEFEQAKAVLANFVRYQNLRDKNDREYGRIPNRVAAGDSIIYNTVDGTPWMLREGLEYLRYTGDKAFAAELYALARPYFDGAVRHYMDAQGLLAHDEADTWMDARIEGKKAWSSRGKHAVEIQALWYTALQTGAYLARQAGDAAQADQWTALAQRAQQSFLQRFWDGKVMADRLRPDGSRDTKVRPNQLMLLSIPFDQFIPPEVEAQVLKNAVPALLYPYGIASLSQEDPYFHPRHENPAFHHKDAAYHQGTIWGWNAGFTVTALNKFGYQDLSWTLTRNLGQQILGLGTLGNMSELLDALPDEKGRLKPSGTFAQSWSVAEFARNGFQDYVGFKPDLLANTLAFVPAIPAGWNTFDATLPFGRGETVQVKFDRSHGAQRWKITLNSNQARTVSFNTLGAGGSRGMVSFELAAGGKAELLLAPGETRLNGKRLHQTRTQPALAAAIGPLAFAVPKTYRPQDFPMLQQRDVLKGIVEREEYR